VWVEVPRLQEAFETATPICGSDFESGQHFWRLLLHLDFVLGWFSTSILDLRGEEVLKSFVNPAF
jgi:hypothetical protein